MSLGFLTLTLTLTLIVGPAILGINGYTGQVSNMEKEGVVELLYLKQRAFFSSFQTVSYHAGACRFYDDDNPNPMAR